MEQNQATAMTQQQFGQHVQVLGWLNIVGHGLFLLIGVFVFMLLSSIGVISRDPTAAMVLSMIGTFVGVILLVLAVPGIAAGIGLLGRRNWGRILAIVIGVLSLPNVPMGTLIGAYALIILTKPEAAEYFARPSDAATPRAGMVSA